MDLLRTLGSAAVSSIVQKSGLNLPFTLSDKVTAFEGKTIWSLYDGYKRDDGSPVSIFIFDANQPPRRNLLPMAKNALRKLRTVRHPDVLKFIDAVETDTTIHIVTERVQPLGKTLQAYSSKSSEARDDWLLWGLHRISVALAFVNDSCVSTHGNVRVDSVFISPSGEWKLGGFELLSNTKDEAAVLYTLGGLLPNANDFASPEVKKVGWSVLKEHHQAVADAYALGLLLHCVFNPTHPLPATVQPPHPPPAPSSRGSIPTNIFPSFKKLLNPNPKSRLSPASFLEIGMSESSGDTGFFANNRLVKVSAGLDNFNLGSESDKASLLRSLKESAGSFPPEFSSHRILPALISALEFGGASANTILPLVLQLGVNVAPADYSAVVLAPVLKLFASPDRGTRMALLDHLSEYAERLDNKAVSDKIWPHLQTGFSDTVPVIREATIKSIDILFPKLSDRIMNNDLLRNLAKMQMDVEPAIRTNTCILIGRLGPSLGHNTKRKVLVPAFSRALKDAFVHARVAGLMAFMATIDCFEIEDLATKVIPCISLNLIDGEKLVRDQAFIALELFVKKLATHAASMPETVINEAGQPNLLGPSALGGQGTLVNSAAGAAGALAGWAMSSLTKKLMPGDLASTMSSVSAIDRPTSAPPPDNVATRPGPAPLAAASIQSALSSPGLPATAFTAPSTSRAKGMQLGANKVPTNAAAAVLADEIAQELDNEARPETVNAWGEDLMDVNADDGDWSAFESASVSAPHSAPLVHAPKPVGLGFGDIGPSVSFTDDDPWGDANATSLNAKGRQKEADMRKFDNQLTYPTLGIKDEDPWGDINTAQSNINGTKTKTDLWDFDNNPTYPALSKQPKRSQGTLSPQSSQSTSVLSTVSPDNDRSVSPTPLPSMVGMSKEEKAAEMARRKEERKQRIAQLKEQKKVAGVRS